MNKPLTFGALVAAVALAYPATAWYLGGRIESAHAEQYAQLAATPYLRVAERNYERGIFSATETVTFEIGAPLQADADEPQQPLRFTVRTDIKHGPLPGFTTVAAGVADSQLVLDESTRQEIAKVLGDKPPVTLHNVYNFNGSGRSTLSSPAFATTVPNAETGETARLAWDGLELVVDFAAGMKHYTMRGGAPKLEVEDADVHLVLSGLTLEGDQQRLFDDDTLLYTGTQKFAVAELRVTPGKNPSDPKPVVLAQRITYDIDAPANGDFIDIAARIGAEVIKVGEQDYGPAHYDLSLKHLHARTLSKLYKEMMKVYGDPTLAAAAGGNPTAAFATLSTPALELLSHAPEISLDRISFSSPHGEARVAARIKLAGIQPEEFSNVMALIGKIDASGEAVVPVALLLQWQDTPSEAERFNRQLAAVAAQGYVSQEGGLLKSSVAFRQGQLSVNGKPFNPMAMGALGGMDHDDEAMLEELEADEE
ncbi:hypothetical protein dqs_3911 [Azoarcus olearius]|uniref:YdgA family protein n=1 Tax=Azoarcus sp. (strain BH72) TaxID=418699 RepID=UPI0008061DB3|nr:YdgA family protein [Azoarcus olearius]ANQ86928.1 hypothetical protein dqs_3911 [Azoarcus olearius]